MADVLHEAQDTHLCALFIKGHGEDGDCECALDAAKHLQAILTELPSTSPLARDAGILAKSVHAAQRNLSQQRPADNPDKLLQLGHHTPRARHCRLRGRTSAMFWRQNRQAPTKHQISPA